MSKLQVLPEETLTLQVLGEIVKSGQPVILPKQLTANGVYSAKQEGASGYDPVTVAVDMTPAYNEGYNKGVAETEAENAEILIDCNVALAEKGADPAETLAEVPGQIDRIEAPNDWHRYSPYIYSVQALFETVILPENTELVLEVPGFGNRMDSFMRTTKNVKKVTLVCENWKGSTLGVYASQAFSTAGSHLKIIDLSKFHVVYGQVSNMFANNYALREIIGELDFSLSTNNNSILGGCSSLEEIRFVAGCLKVGTNFSPCSKLSNDSIRSILDGLADLTGTATQTVTFHKDVGAKLTDVQKAAATAKNWTLVY